MSEIPPQLIDAQLQQHAKAATPAIPPEMGARLKSAADMLSSAGKLTKKEFYGVLNVSRKWEYNWQQRIVNAGTIENQQGQGGGKPRVFSDDDLVRIWDVSQNEFCYDSHSAIADHEGGSRRTIGRVLREELLTLMALL